MKHHLQNLTGDFAGRICLTILFCALSVFSFAQMQEISSDMQDYYPGDTVVLTGSGWQPNEVVQIVLVHSIPFHPNDVLYSTADASGNFVNTDYIVQWQELGEYYICTATGQSSNNTATIYFTDSPRIGSVTITPGMNTACIPSTGTTQVSYTVQANRAQNGTVNGSFTVTGVPAGVTANSLAGFTAGGGTPFPSRTLTLTISSSAGAGTFVIAVKCADGGDSATGTCLLVLNSSPTFTACPSNITTNTDAGVCTAVVTYNAAASGGTLTYTFSGATSASGNGTGSGSTFNKGTTNVTITAAGSCTQDATCSFTVAVNDNQAPSITCPANVAVSCSSSVPSPNTASVIAADNCGMAMRSFVSDIITNQTCTDKYTLTRTYRATDASGNSSTCAQVITVNDNLAPSFTKPADVIIFSGAGCTYDASVSATGDVTNEADNCSSTLNATFSDVITPGTCQGEVIIERTWSLVDNCGNAAASQLQYITVEDNTVPTFNKPADITIFTGAGCVYDASVSATGDVTDEADNCSTGLNATFIDVVSPRICAGEVTISRTWSLADNCGNAAANQLQIITVLDNTAPTFTKPADITIFTDAGCLYDATVSATGDVTNEADNCSTGIDATFSDATAAGTCQGEVIITRTWSLVDNCGNAAANQIQIIDVKDNTSPTFSKPADITIFTNAGCLHDATVSATGDVTNEADNCSTGIDATFSDATAAGSCQGEVIITRTWSLMDNCGNAAANQIQIIDVQDNTSPTFTKPADITIFTDAGCLYDATVSATGDVTNEADNCSTGIDATFSDATAAGSCQGEVIITRTWSLMDNCGNTAANQIQIIDVQDNTSPTFSKPADITIFTNAGCLHDATVSATGDVTNEADNCSTGIDATFSDATAAGSCQGEVIITRTWSLVDNCGNAAADQIQIIDVQDNTAPAFTKPADITIFTNAGCTYDASVSATSDVINEADNCSTGLDATFSDATAAGSCQGEVIITRTWSLMDNCGNAAADQIQIIDVQDNTAPAFTKPADITIFTNAGCIYDASVSSTGDVTNEADNCSTGIDATFSDATAAGSCQGEVIITRTWSLVDNCGNAAADQIQIIDVQDNTAPAFTKPADITIFTNAGCTYDASVSSTGDVTNEADNCSTGIDATFSDATAAGSCQGEVIITRTWSLVDNCGNAAANQIQIIDVQDNTVPTFTKPADITIFTNAGCTYDASVSSTGDVTNEADNCSTGLNATFSDATAPGTCLGEIIITRTWSLVDNCGNAAANQIQIIDVQDNTAPTFTKPADITIFTNAGCLYDASISATGDVTNEADNCSTGLNATFSDATAAGSCQGEVIITRTWSLVDNCGNAAANQIQIIDVQDNTAPAFTKPADITIFTNAGCLYDASVSATGDVTNEADNCSTGLDATFSDATAPGGCQGKVIITRTWSLVDNCGNSAANQVQTITVEDNISPVIACTANQVLPMNSGACTYTASGNEFDLVSATDNCSSVNKSYSLSGMTSGSGNTTLAGVSFNKGVTTVTWTAADACSNSSTCSFTVTVNDTEIPTITCPANIVAVTEPGLCGATVNYSVTFADNCTGSVMGQESGQASATFYSIGTTTNVFKVIDASGNFATCSFTVTVNDNQLPVISGITKSSFNGGYNVSCFGNCNGSATVSATDNCPASITYLWSNSQTSATATGLCAGVYTVTVSDGTNSVSSNVTITQPAQPVANAGVDEFTYFGYSADQSVSHTAVVSGGVAPYSYSWSLNRALKCNVVNSAGDETFSGGSCSNNSCPASPLNTTTGSAPVCNGSATVTTALMDTAVVCVTITDANGCTVTDCFSIHSEDARCFAGSSGNAKVKICHRSGSGNNISWGQLCIDETAVASHLAHGDYVGKCGSRLEGDLQADASIEFSVYPNPNNGTFTLDFHSNSNEDVKIYMTNAVGQTVYSKIISVPFGVFEGMIDNGNIEEGYYVIHIQQGQERVNKSVVVIR